MKLKLGRLTFHLGADYACVMGEKQTTEDAIAWLYGQSQDVEAYGRLFSAAPDMLAALRELVAADLEAQETVLDRPANDRAINRLLDARRTAALAIAKAEGSSAELSSTESPR